MGKSILVFSLLLWTVSVQSQDILTTTISWNSTNTLDVTSNNSVSEATTFSNNQSINFNWKNSDGTIRKTYQIIEAIGKWSNVSNDGRMQYEVTDGRLSGTISIVKQGVNTKIKIAMEASPPETVELTITSIQIN